MQGSCLAGSAGFPPYFAALAKGVALLIILFEKSRTLPWIAVSDLSLSYYIGKTKLITMYIYIPIMVT